MQKWIIILFVLFGNASSAQTDSAYLIAQADTIEENKIIKEIETVKAPPSQDKVQYFSQLTRYGFKNLFNKFKYNPTLPYSSQINPHAELYMQDYLKNHSHYLVKMKSWGVPYFNLIDNILSKYGLPTELKYLAVIESNLSTSATSWVGAGGPWQFMPYTARDYGLKVDKLNDERRDYFKSTHAAARYLLSLYNQLHDWLLVIAAYNGGPSRVFSAIKKSGSSNFWQLQYFLPEESRNHVKKFIATHYIMENPSINNAKGTGFFKPLGADNGTPDNNPLLPEEMMKNADKQTVSGKYNGAIIAKNLNMPLTEFNQYNPGFDERLGRNGQYDMILPQEKMQLFLSIRYQILNECVQALLGNAEVPNNKTTYPSSSKTKSKKKPA